MYYSARRTLRVRIADGNAARTGLSDRRIIYQPMIESVLLLFLVVDPFGNLPVVLAVVGKMAPSRYRRIIIREVTFAFLVLLLFAFAG